MLLAIVDVRFTMPSLCCKVLLHLVSALLQVSVLAFLTGYCCCVLQGTVVAFLTVYLQLLCVAGYRRCFSDSVLTVAVCCRVRD